MKQGMMILACAAPLWAAACTTPEATTGPASLVEAPSSSSAPLLFNSEITCSGKTAEIGVLNDQTILRVDGRDYVLAQVVTASGEKYVWAGEPETSFWGKGEGGLLTVGGTAYPDCVRTGGYAEPETVSPAPSVWRARGNEPGWVVTLDGETMSLNYDYGSGTYSAPEPEPVTLADGQQWTDAEGRLSVTALNKVCHDNMTGMPHPSTVTVNYADRVFQGCGGEPVSLLAGDEWRVEAINQSALVEGSRVTITFDAETGRAGGRGGCNSYSAAFALTGESLTFGPVMSTQMACEDPVMQQEMRLHDTLGEVTGFQIADDGALVLTVQEQGQLVARR